MNNTSTAPRPQDIAPQALSHQTQRLCRATTPPWLHAEVATRMAERLAIIKLQPAKVLQWSAFLGASGAALAEVYPKAEQVCVEPLPEGAERSRAQHARGLLQRLAGRAAVPVVAPAEVSPGQAQLVWSNMELHAQVDAPGLVAQWHKALAVDGFVMFSCLGPDSFAELRALHVRHGWGAAGPEWWDMHDVGDLLVNAGFADPVMDQDRITLTWSEPEKLLRDLRALGGNLSPQRFPGLRGRQWRAAYLDALNELRDADGRIKLTLELVQGHAFKPQPKLRVQAQTEVSLDQMREMLKKP
ncbi:MAG TPA: biotin synthase [Burkholderiaceae bacterium]|jgi:malonyl-CoA O-methyltransferase